VESNVEDDATGGTAASMDIGRIARESVKASLEDVWK
tara:strand:+ start:4069 stop:4179 length:111 start_codon:yes stop_codon:yes gene_type:complete